MKKIARTEPLDVNEIFEKRVYEGPDGDTLPYRLYIPKHYDCGEYYPLVLFLHGSGEKGTDNEDQIRVGLPAAFLDPASPVYDAIVVAPQCPNGAKWVNVEWEEGNFACSATPEAKPLAMARGILEELKTELNVDEDRVYVTGLSMGGFGTWDLLTRHGSLFAAGMPVCGCGDPSYARLLRRIPIRSFHGSEDDAVPVSGDREMFEAIRRAGGTLIDYTEFDGAGHFIWDTVYGDTENWTWLFRQSREARRLAAERKSRFGKTAAVGGGALAAFLVLLSVVKTRQAERERKKRESEK